LTKRKDFGNLFNKVLCETRRKNMNFYMMKSIATTSTTI